MMLSPVETAKKLQFLETVVPRRWRLPMRYRGQRLVGGLEAEMTLLEGLVRPGGVALDVGANRGIYAYALSRIAKEVHCFEPLAECCRYIRDYASDRIIVHNVALSDRAGHLRLYVPIIAGRAVQTRASLDLPPGQSQSREITVRTLDSFAFPRVDFVKMDVEGLEAAVLRGGRATLESHHPTLLVEIDRARHTRESFMSVFASLTTLLGYKTWVCENHCLRRCEDPWSSSSEHINFIFRFEADQSPAATR